VAALPYSGLLLEFDIEATLAPKTLRPVGYHAGRAPLILTPKSSNGDNLLQGRLLSRSANRAQQSFR